MVKVDFELHKLCQFMLWFSLGQIKKIPVFKVTRPNLNLLLKPRFFSGFLENM